MHHIIIFTIFVMPIAGSHPTDTSIPVYGNIHIV